jgi:hypothetical protein
MQEKCDRNNPVSHEKLQTLEPIALSVPHDLIYNQNRKGVSGIVNALWSLRLRAVPAENAESQGLGGGASRIRTGGAV